MTTPRILYLDAYDSSSNNITSLLRSELRATVSSIKIDDPRFVLNDDAFLHFLSGFDAVVAGPGPGHPGNPKDTGLILKLWALPDERVLPVLGICLGFQSMCLAFGGRVERLREPRHGLVTPVTHCGRDVFEGSGEVLATQYHSLHVRIHADDDVAADNLYERGKACPDVQPLAWDLSDAANGRILMGARHVGRPFWGVQYHPESICTNDEGRQLIRNWWREACAWSQRACPFPNGPDAREDGKERVDSGRTSEDVQVGKVHWRSLSPAPTPDPVAVVEMLREDCSGYEPLLLESGTRHDIPVNAETGRFTIIGVQDAASTHIQYSTSTHHLKVQAHSNASLDRSAPVSDIFELLETFTAERKAIGGPSCVPFWGGLVGYISYEAGLESIGVQPPEVNEEHPDVWFVFVEKSIVVDHVEGTVYVQSLTEDDWVERTVKRLQKLRAQDAKHGDTARHCEPAQILREPAKANYCAKVLACQEQLRAGESYELCLTDTTLLQPPPDNDDWSLYLRLRASNPAPFGAYLPLFGSGSTTDLTIASSSPERFLSWARDGECQFRPIKGTVRKEPGVTKAHAQAILQSPKEQAENLMIVDLIRHDLSGVNGVTNVTVPKLMTTEEYATVYQLVSVITGMASNPIAALAASLPPGSMTGAPKNRSCELLRQIESTTATTTPSHIEQQHTRGIYSGVLGYLDVGGGGDFAVAIRTAFKWRDEGCWRVGAGGAVTVLSTAAAEWEEMRAKRESVLGAFGVG